MTAGHRRSVTLRLERLRYRAPFRIAGHLFEESAVLVAEISQGGHRGLGEGAGVYFLQDDAQHMLSEAESVRAALEAGAGRVELQNLLPPGGARNALDCALWDLEAAQTNTPCGNSQAWSSCDRSEPPSPLAPIRLK